MSEPVFRDDAYLTKASGRVIARTAEGGVILDRTIFYPTGGGQPGDSGRLDWAGASLPVGGAIKGEGGDITLIPGVPIVLPPVGSEAEQVMDWDRRFGHMRVHTALHLLSVAVAPIG